MSNLTTGGSELDRIFGDASYSYHIFPNTSQAYMLFEATFVLSMASTEELANLETWLSQHSDGYTLAFGGGGFLTTDEVRQLAESSSSLEVEGQKVWMTWNDNLDSRLDRKFETIVAISNEVRDRVKLGRSPINVEDFCRRSPEPLELFDGYLGSNMVDAFNVLDMSLESFGLLEVVRRAPKELWLEAIRQVYGSD